MGSSLKMKLKEFTVLVLISLYWGQARSCQFKYGDMGRDANLDAEGGPKNAWALKDQSGAGSKIPKMIVDCVSICFSPPSSNAPTNGTNATSPVATLNAANAPTNGTNATSPVATTTSPAIGNACEACINDNKGNDFSLGDVARKLCGDSEISNQNPFCKAIPGQVSEAEDLNGKVRRNKRVRRKRH